MLSNNPKRGKPNNRRNWRPRSPNQNHNESGGESLVSHFRPVGVYQNLITRYMTLAKESLSGGDRVMAEYHYQHADHYVRVVNELRRHAPPQKTPQESHAHKGLSVSMQETSDDLEGELDSKDYEEGGS